MQTIVLNADFTFLNVVSWKKAIKLLIKEKAETVQESNFLVNNKIKLPAVLRLYKLVRGVYRNKVPYSKKNVFIRDSFTCQYCGAQDNLTVDHILPRSRGGKSCFNNCVTSCKSCNHAKGSLTPKEANLTLRKAPHEPSIVEFLITKMRKLGLEDYLTKDIFN